MGLLHGAASGLGALMRALGVVLVYVVVLIALPLFVAGVLVDYMMFRPVREQAVVARLRVVEDLLLDDDAA